MRVIGKRNAVCLLAVTLAIAAVPTVARGDLIYACDFEVAEGYVLGPLGGQQGWSSDLYTTVQDIEASSGDNAIAMPADGMYNPDMVMKARRFFDNPVPAYTLVTVSQAVMIDTTGEADWVVALMSNGDLVTYVHFDWLGGVTVNGSPVVGFSWAPGVWTDLVCVLDFVAETADVTLGGNPIYSGALMGNPAQGVDNVNLLSDNFIDAKQTTMFYDNLLIDAIPEPATFALLGFGVVGLMARRRTKK